MKAEPRFLLVLLCFVLSGLAGLIYETAWMQQFALVFGSSQLALVTVLAAYMAGLALGAAAAGRFAHRVRRPVLTYALLELGIAAAALAVPAVVGVASRLHVALLGSDELPTEAESLASGLFYLVTSFSILLVPTALMGATLPLLARWCVRREAEIGPRVGVLYSANTAGAAAGTLLAAYFLLPRLGLGRTVLAAAAVNLLVFGLAALLARASAARSSARNDAAHSPVRRAGGQRWILPLVLVSGAVSFTWEILWTRLLTQLLGGSVYAFATMLATFLVGISLGSALAARLARGHQWARCGFAVAQLGVAGFSLAAFALANRLPSFALAATDEGFLARGAAIGAAILLPGALAIGATFPFAVRILARNAAEAPAASARVFSWNTVGAIAGTLIAGYWMLPTLRFAGTATVVTVASLGLAMVTTLASRPRRPILAAVALAGLVMLALRRPTTPWELLRHSPSEAWRTPGEVAYYGVGRGATVLLFERPGEWRLTTDGLAQSAVASPSGRPGRYVAARWLSLLPHLARPELRSFLVVGLGAGITVEDVPPTVEEIHVVELEPEVVRANRRVAERRREDPLTDERLSLYSADARGALRITGRRFDTIVSQPSHPWTSGASHLFTREFFTLVRERLTPSGTFVQWMGLAFVDEELLRSLVATAVHVFDYVEVYQPVPSTLLVLASPEPLNVDTTAAQALESARREWEKVGVRVTEDLLAARVLDSDGARRFARGGRLSTDSHNLFRTRSPKALRNPLHALTADDLLAPFAPPTTSADTVPAESLYVIRRLIRQRATRRAHRLTQSLPDPVARQTARGLLELGAGRAEAARRSLRRALELDAGFEEATSALLRLYRGAIAAGQLPPFAARARQDPAAAVVEGWQRIAAGDWRAVRRLEARLVRVGFHHPLFNDALRLRARWRIDSGEAPLASEALELLGPLLAPVPRPDDLLLRAHAGAVAGEPEVSLATLAEALPRLGASSAREGTLKRELRSLAEALPIDEKLAQWRREILSRLEAKTPPR